MAHALGMERSLLRYEGSGHTAFFRGNACIDATTEAYLVDRKVPAEGFSCPAEPISFGPPALTSSGLRGTTVHVDTLPWTSPPIRLPVIRVR
jgi:hypothetical protein